GAVRTVRPPARAARRASAAAAVDLADHAPALVEALLGDADELVAQHAAESHVAADQLQVGVADACPKHAHADLPVAWRRRRSIRLEGQGSLFEDNRTHSRRRQPSYQPARPEGRAM